MDYLESIFSLVSRLDINSGVIDYHIVDNIFGGNLIYEVFLLLNIGDIDFKISEFAIREFLAELLDEFLTFSEFSCGEMKVKLMGIFLCNLFQNLVSNTSVGSSDKNSHYIVWF